jgi:uncharacterized protein (DUF362 family)/NAD-dependent dihydropyrimidine dehydrogenase PreA subunit
MDDPLRGPARPPAGAPRVSIVRLGSYEPGAVAEGVAAVLAPLGGMAAFVRPGTPVLLKPNFLLASAPERAICTHPEILRAVARLARQAGASAVEATDSPGVGTATRCARRLGLSADDPLTVLDADEGVDVAPPGASFHRLRLVRRLRDADTVINLPKAKTHGQMLMTGAVKNSFGAVVGMEKPQWHFRAGKSPADFARLLVHIHGLIAPRLSLLDAVVGMEGNGPSGGDPRPLGFLAASTNAHALDAVLARVWGLDPGRIFTLAAARDLGLLPAPDAIEIVGPSPESLRPRPAWKLPRLVPLRGFGGPAWLNAALERLMRLEPAVVEAKCSGCGECGEVCAAGAITLEPDGTRGARRVVIDCERCIACFCCQEMCPQGAIEVSAGLAARLFRLGTGRRKGGTAFRETDHE